MRKLFVLILLIATILVKNNVCFSQTAYAEIYFSLNKSLTNDFIIEYVGECSQYEVIADSSNTFSVKNQVSMEPDSLFFKITQISSNQKMYIMCLPLQVALYHYIYLNDILFQSGVYDLSKELKYQKIEKDDKIIIWLKEDYILHPIYKKTRLLKSKFYE